MAIPVDLPGLDDVDWAGLHGAYGASSEAAASLRVLASDRARDSDARADAYDYLLWSHCYHQGTIYPVSAAVVPWLVALVDGGADLDSEIAAGLAAYAAATARELAAGHNLEVARSVETAFVEVADQVFAWRGKRARYATAVSAQVPAVRPRWVAMLRPTRLTEVQLLGLAAGTTVPAWAIAAAIARPSEAGAVLLFKHAPDAPGARAAIRRAIKSNTASRVEDDWSEWRFSIEVPPYVAPTRVVDPAPSVALVASYDGELRQGRVVFAGPSLVLVRVGAANITAHVPDTGLARGDRVKISPGGELLVYHRPDGTLARALVGYR